MLHGAARTALGKVARNLPRSYAGSDWTRLAFAVRIADEEIMPSFAPLIDACRETAAVPERREFCLKSARILQRDVSVAILRDQGLASDPSEEQR